LAFATILVALALIAAACSDSEEEEATAAPATQPTATAGPSDASITTASTITETALLRTPPDVPAPITRKEAALVKIELETIEKTMTLAEGVEYQFWTFNGSVPGPLLRVRQGDTIELTLKNNASSKFAHSIDLHAVTGPGGGAVLTQTAPGKSKTFSFKALNPGVYVYHCATPLIPQHITNGLYGLIVVEPKEGLPPVDKEFYVMEGDIYTVGKVNDPGLQEFSLDKMLAETPEYVVFNGAVGSLAGDKALKANVGDRVRIYFGVGGPNVVSSFHVIGEIFDEVHPEGTREGMRDVQTTLVPAGGATWVDFTVEVPGRYILVDHSLSRLVRGAAGFIEVAGADAPHIFKAIGDNQPSSEGH
jgi:nitrite reductase (NO-forming)